MNSARPPRHRRRLGAAALALLLVTPALPATEDPPTAGNTARPHQLVPSGPFDLARLMNVQASHYYLNQLTPAETPILFLPPDPPALETPIPLRSPLDLGVPPPAELAAHLGELFYPQLAARLATDSLPRKARVKLDTYRAAGTGLLDELRRALAAPPAGRLSALAECARQQAARLQELEMLSEQIRSELGGTPAERLVAARSAGGPEAELPIPDTLFLRSIAFHVDGLSTEQRRLLLSSAAERDRRPDRSAAPAFFFAPEGASLDLPAPLDPALAAQVAAYTDARHELADQLVQALRALTRGEEPAPAVRLAQLATEQAPAFRALEQKAEAIREALQGVLEPGVAVPALPPELAVRFAAYRERKQALYRQIHAAITQSTREASAAAPAGARAVPLSALTAAQQADLAALNHEHDALRAALAEHRRADGAGVDRKSIDTLLADFERARQLQELRGKYADYRTALLAPGLSAAQRRLLFGAALQGLEIPLPTGTPLRRP